MATPNLKAVQPQAQVTVADPNDPVNWDNSVLHATKALNMLEFVHSAIGDRYAAPRPLCEQGVRGLREVLYAVTDALEETLLSLGVPDPGDIPDGGPVHIGRQRPI